MALVAGDFRIKNGRFYSAPHMLGERMPEESSETERQVQFTRHFAECERSMLAFAYSLIPNRADADDVVQETLAALWKHFDDFDPDRPFLPWANRFIYRQVQMHRRKQATRAKYFFSDETIEQLAKDESFSLERDRAMAAALEKCLQKLSAKNRELVEQRYLSKGSLQEFAEQSGRTSNALYKMLQRIRESLHQCITQRLAREGFTA
jgi:RNA polymerase sigma-70 factor (ECF subfamily)